MIALLKRHSTLLFIACSAGLLLLRLNLGLPYAFSLAILLCLALGKAYVDGHGSQTGLVERVCHKVREAVAGFVALLRLEKDVHFALIGRFPSQAAKRSPAKDVFAFIRTDDYSVVFGLLMIGSVVDIPLLHLLIHHAAPEAYRWPLHGAAAFLTLYGLVWLISDYRALKASTHEVTATELHFRLGWRVSGTLPLANIVDVRRAPESLRRWRREQGLKRREIGLITPLDAANVLIEIDPGPLFTVLAMRRPAARYLAVYVDEPARFIDCIARAREAMPAPAPARAPDAGT